MSLDELAGAELDAALLRVGVLEEQVRHRALHDPLLGATAPQLASAGVRALYDGPHSGWFASNAGREQLCH